MIRLTYQKKSGEVVYRTSLCTQFKIGDVNGFGWKVVNKEYYYNKKYRSFSEYNMLTEKSERRLKTLSKIKKKLFSFYKDLAYSIFLLILLRIFEALLGK